ncbi:Ger(x)C family spore germination C-terminal domain-containing protein [Peribacillus butanolivorans]|uniref:Ger(x)C family spore germination C-terminal domain-containing protein n=1 Tax=Peribacillus butanolivorans TaxID=421767 RepID=UPI0030CA070F
MELLKPKLKRRVINIQNDIKIGLDIKFTGIIRQSTEGVIAPKIKKMIEEKIRNEVYESYVKSQEISGDIYQFEDYMYRFKNSDWKKFHDSEKFPTLMKEDIHVKVAPLKSISKINSDVSSPPH